MVGLWASTVTALTLRRRISARRAAPIGDSVVVMAGPVAMDVQRRLGEARAEAADDALQFLVELLRLGRQWRTAGLRGGGLGRELGQVDGEELAVLDDHAAADHHGVHAG